MEPPPYEGIPTAPPPQPGYNPGYPPPQHHPYYDNPGQAPYHEDPRYPPPQGTPGYQAGYHGYPAPPFPKANHPPPPGQAPVQYRQPQQAARHPKRAAHNPRQYQPRAPASESNISVVHSTVLRMYVHTYSHA